MFEHFTDRSRKVMALANQEASRFNHDHIGTEHLLLGLIKEGSGVACSVLKRVGISDLSTVRVAVEKLVKVGPEMMNMGRIPQTPHAKQVIEYAMEEARGLNHNYIGTEHLLLGLIRVEGIAFQVLKNLNINVELIREDIQHLLGGGDEDPEVEVKVTEEALIWLSGQADIATKNRDYTTAVAICKAIDIIIRLQLKPVVLRDQKKTWTTKVAVPKIAGTRISTSEYIMAYGEYPVVTYDMVKKVHTKEECEHFAEWMYGQTCMGLEDGRAGIYADDYERWLRQGKKTEQAENWD